MVHHVLPPLWRTSADAAKFAAAIHANDTDDTGGVLTAHLGRVAACVERLVEGCPFWTLDHRDDAVQVAWLHHALIDGRTTARDLQRECFSRVVIDDIKTLTRDCASTYWEWPEETARDAHLAAVLVMLADLEVNCHSISVNVEAENDSGLEDRRDNVRTMLIGAARLKGWDGDLELISLQQ